MAEKLEAEQKRLFVVGYITTKSALNTKNPFIIVMRKAVKQKLCTPIFTCQITNYTSNITN